MSEESNEGDKGEFNWREHLNEEHAEQPGLKDFTDINALAKSYLDTKKMVGGMIRIPGSDAPVEDIAKFKARLLEGDFGVLATPAEDDAEGVTAFRRKLGMPETATGYSAVEGMTEDRFKQLSTLAHDAGIGDKQLTKLLSGMVANDNEMLSQLTDVRSTDISGLKQEWGDAYKEKVARALQMVELTKAPAALKEAIVSGQSDAATLKWLDSLADSLGSEGQHLKDDMNTITSETLDELALKRDELNRKLIKEKFPPSEYSRLQAKLVGMNERLVNLRKRA